MFTNWEYYLGNILHVFDRLLQCCTLFCCVYHTDDKLHGIYISVYIVRLTYFSAYTAYTFLMY